MRDDESGIDVVEYILTNPVRSGIVPVAKDYEYSGTPNALDSSYVGK